MTIALDVTVNPMWAPDPIALLQVASAYDISDPNSVLFFESYDPAIAPGGMLITNVVELSTLAAGVPEPTTLLLLALGLAMVAACKFPRANTTGASRSSST